MKEPSAYIFELATLKDKSTDEYSGWKEYIQVSKPHVPTKAIRNLRPLFAGEIIDYKNPEDLNYFDASLRLNIK